MKHPYQIQDYFAYGSNMNPARMRARGIEFIEARGAVLQDYGLRFNKRATGKQSVAYANVVYAPGEWVEGVAYRLARIEDIVLMDPFEGSPVRYSRDVYNLRTIDGPIAAWVYVANRAMLAEGLLPERNYLNHLLAGREWLSDNYHNRLVAQPCIENSNSDSSDDRDGLIHNV